MQIKPVIDRFLRSEYFANWQAEHIEAGSYSRDADRRDRFARCTDAAENGADGSTHREAIADMREGFRSWLQDCSRQNRRLPFAEYPYRLEDAAMRYFDDLEAWHEANGSIDQEIG